MQRVILCPNPCKDKGYAVTRQVRDLLEGAGYAVSVSPELLDGAEAELPEDLEGCELLSALSDAVLIARFAAEDKTAVINDQGLRNADCDGKAGVDGSDMTRVLQYIAKQLTKEQFERKQ